MIDLSRQTMNSWKSEAIDILKKLGIQNFASPVQNHISHSCTSKGGNILNLIMKALECEEKVSKDCDNGYKIKRKITIKENFVS